MNRQQPRQANSGFRRSALVAAAVVLVLVVPAVTAGAEPMTTPVSEAPNPTTAESLCVSGARCRPIGDLSVDPDRGLVTTGVSLSGACGRALGPSDPETGVTIFFGGPTVGALQLSPGTDVDFDRGSFVHNLASFAALAPGRTLAPGLYRLAARCDIAAAGGGPSTWLTPPATFCLYAADDDPAGCTATGLEHYANEIDAWGFFSGTFIEQIGAQFTPAAPIPAPLPAETTPTTRRRTTTPTMPVTEPPTDPPPPPPPPCDPNVPPYCPK
jgi:hypothetical protein